MIGGSDRQQTTLYLILCILGIFLQFTVNLRNFLNKVIDIINFTKLFLNFTNDTMICYLKSILDLNLSCARDFGNQSFMAS